MDERLLNRRIAALGLGLALIGVLMLGRLMYLQVIRHAYYKVLANQEQLHKYEINPTRGEIYVQDRGKLQPLVLNRSLKTLYVDTHYVLNREDTARQLAELTGDKATDYAAAMDTESSYIVLKKQVEPSVAKQIDELQLGGVGLSDAPTRVYPEGSLAAQVLGFVNNDRKGQYGVEEYLNAQLGGTTGLLNAKTDTRGIPIATSDNVQVEPKDGSKVVLSLERNVQAKVEQVLKAGVSKYQSKNASAVVLDVNTGAIVAMANYPTFDPAKYTEVGDYSVFANRAATGLYEPGSVLKVFSMSAGLDTGAVTPTATYTNTGSTQVGDRKIENADDAAYRGTQTMTNVITHSLNTGVVEVLRRLGGNDINQTGKAKLHDYYTNHFLFGKPTGIEVPAEPGGTINPPSSDDANYANMSFGQGMTATLVQLAAAAAAVVNGGTYYQPHLVDRVIDPSGQVTLTQPVVKNQQIISAQTSAQIKAMMETVVTSGGGTSNKLAGYRIGGKTGTAQIPNPEGGYFNNRDIGSFISAGPLDKPRYVVMVRTDEPHAGGPFAGSAAAAPMAGEIMRWIIGYQGVPPS